MQVRSVGQWLFVFSIVAACGVPAVSCGGGAGNSTFDKGAQDAANELSDGTVKGGDDGPGLIGSGDGGDGGNRNCKTCAELGVNCGMNGDGCGGVINCGTCPAGQICGGGGFDRCGGASTGDGSAGGDGGSSCKPITKCSADDGGTLQNCGFQGDGCGGAPIQCGAGCTSPQFCGGGGFNVCGGNNGLSVDGSVPCAPASTCSGGQNCGFQGDGCGGTLVCGAGCTSPQFCGGGGFNVCGGNNGLKADGATNCNPTTCAALKLDCGPAGDGCGGLLQCGSCSGSQICGGGGVPGNCGNSQCTGLCLQQGGCDSGALTTITGTVVAGTLPVYGSPDPVPNVLVYVPNAPLSPFGAGVSCSQCGAEVSGSPLVQTTTAFDGTFTLANVPAGSSIPVVLQLGRWRKTTLIDIPACATTPIANLVMPRTSLEGNIPLTAISSGSVDSLECVLLKMGVDKSEFTTPATGGRMQMYEGNGASLPGGTPAETKLMAAGGSYAAYDQILFPCWGSEVLKPSAELANLVTYANEGGHFFATHFSYTWLFNNSPFDTTAQWDVNYSAFNSGTAQVQVPPVNPEGTVFTEWLNLVGALPAPPNLTIQNPRHDVDRVNPPSVDWISGPDPGDQTDMLYHYTFNTPVAVGDAGSPTQCGHVIFSDFHVANASTNKNTLFPSECDTHPMTAQEKVLEFMIWDLGQCVPGPPTPPTCTPLTCQQQGVSCGPAGDGCGNEIMCGNCVAPATCGGGGKPGVCGAPDGGSCAPKSCAQQNITCGPAGDGCGNGIPSCGSCQAPQTCGGGGVPGQCGYPDAGACQPLTCSAQNIFCGPAGDGCGNLIPSCGTCAPPQTCGGGGVSGQCGSLDAGLSCSPTSCQAQGLQCGTASDGCGNALACGACPTGQMCSATGKCVGSQ